MSFGVEWVLCMDFEMLVMGGLNPLTLLGEGERRERFRPVRRGEVFTSRPAGIE